MPMSAPLACREIRLTAGRATEPVRAVDAVRRRGLPLLAVRRADFPLPALGDRLARTAAALETDAPAAVLRGLPVEGRTEADLRALFWGLGRHLGIAVPQDATGRVVGRAGVELRPCPAGRFHTEGSDVLALLVTAGSATCDLVDAEAVVDEVTRRSPALAMRLFDPIAMDLGEAGHRRVPLACREGGRLSLRYDRGAIDAARDSSELPSLSAEQIELLDLVDEIAGSPALRTTVQLDAGDLLLVNNWSLLHRFDAEASPLRLWLTLREGRALPPGFTWPTWAYGDRPGRGGVDPRDLAEPVPLSR
jgi:hypothetical protein